MRRLRIWLLFLYGFLTVVGVYFLTRLKFSFDFEQFFPKGDPDWEFFKAYIQDFESDDNFLLVALERKAGVFEQSFLKHVHDFTLRARELPHVINALSITTVRYPVRTPFGVTTVPAIHLDDTTYYASDRERILQDKRFVHNLIAEDATALTVILKTVNQSTYEQSVALMNALDSLIAQYPFEAVHRLGRAYFHRDMVAMQKREIAVSTTIAVLLASAILFFIFRRWRTVLLAMTGIGLALLLFLAVLSVLGRELNALAALYPILMCIVGVADTIHLTTKYLHELEKGRPPAEAIRITVREIGLATLITCVTTAIGFLSLLTNRTEPIQAFGVNAALGVVLAFAAIYGWLWIWLPQFTKDQLIKPTPEWAFWGRFMRHVYVFTRTHQRRIAWLFAGALGASLIGISLIHTDYRIRQNLPRGAQITRDFIFFEQKFAGFRPLEIAVFPQRDFSVEHPAVLREIDRVEQRLEKYPAIRTHSSINDLYRSLHAMHTGNRADAYRLPPDDETLLYYQRLAERLPNPVAEVLISKNRDKARIAARIQDIGRDSIVAIQEELERWIAQHTDTTVVRFRITGTGVVIDKNSAYIRDNMLQGLIPSVLTVALLMALLFRDARLVVIFTIPNILPLFFAGAFIGFLDIPLEAGVATVFSIVFGIATDDTVHFLSTLRLCRSRGMNIEQALETTILETGKAMTLSSIILFFAFLVLLFSVHPPSVIVGVLISATLASALLCDLYLSPVLVRWLLRDQPSLPSKEVTLPNVEKQQYLQMVSASEFESGNR
ncbi:MAG: MMPL family transporter [Saprospiraceae bacterium]|nr:MMPL family transporter [Saprospiraceae bacterium]MDW8482912.1 MMPL family transporter [Saprospiraceae bacterium]